MKWAKAGEQLIWTNWRENIDQWVEYIDSEKKQLVDKNGQWCSIPTLIFSNCIEYLIFGNFNFDKAWERRNTRSDVWSRASVSYCKFVYISYLIPT